MQYQKTLSKLIKEFTKYYDQLRTILIESKGIQFAKFSIRKYTYIFL